MPRYDEIWGALADKIFGQATLDVQSFARMAKATGMTEAAFMASLDEDLANDGPIFGKFKRNLGDAAARTTGAAVNQGEAIGYIANDPGVSRLARLAGRQGSVLDAIETADPEIAQELEQEFLAEEIYVWICALVNTCPECLPYHGTELPMADWDALGIVPGQVHPRCRCKRVPKSKAGGRKDLMAPLKRVKVKGQSKTIRAITKKDIEDSLDARDKAMQTPQGRAALRKLGNAGA